MAFEEAEETFSSVELAMEESESFEAWVDTEESSEAWVDTEEWQEEVEEDKKCISTFREALESLKRLPTPVKAIGQFMAKMTAIAAIFFGVTVGLMKLQQKIEGDPATKKKAAKIKAFSQFITSAAELSKTVADWLAEHKDEEIKLEGIAVKVGSIFEKYTGELETVSAHA